LDKPLFCIASDHTLQLFHAAAEMQGLTYRKSKSSRSIEITFPVQETFEGIQKFYRPLLAFV
jgi:hypothetical protein